jgi:hypothetical protein
MTAVEPTEAGTSIPFGPVQMLVVEPEFTGKILPEFKRLKELDVVRLIDLLVVRKGDDGELDVYKQSDLAQDEATEFGALVGALVGLGTGTVEGVESAARAGAEAMEDRHLLDEESVWYVADAIPPGTAAAIALIEHRWAIPLRDRIVEAGGFSLADEWIHPADLVAIGVAQAASTSGRRRRRRPRRTRPRAPPAGRAARACRPSRRPPRPWSRACR